MEEKNFLITENNVEEYANKMAKWIKEQVSNANVDGVTLGMSGGVDCSTVARLCQLANIKVELVLMPYGDNMKNVKSYDDTMKLINKFNFQYHIFDIKPAVDNIQIKDENILNNGIKENIELSVANIKPRMRMIYLYQYAQINNLLVIGTSNLSERTVGYSTKWGDGASDFNPLGNITKREVYILARYLGVPDCIINKKPSADLWTGQSDEDEMGLTYEQIDNFILEGTSFNEEIDNKIITKIKKSQHKINQIPMYKE